MKTISFKCRLKEILESLDMTQKRIADLTGLSVTVVGRYHNNNMKQIDLDSVAKIMEVLELNSLDELFETTVGNNNNSSDVDNLSKAYQAYKQWCEENGGGSAPYPSSALSSESNGWVYLRNGYDYLGKYSVKNDRYYPPAS